MPLLRSLLGGRAIKSSDAPWDSIFEGQESATGKRVTPQTSMRVAAVYAAVRLLAESISSLPSQLVLRDGDRRRTQDGQLADLLTVQPNPEQDAPELWRTVMGWMLLEGDGYVFVERYDNGRPVGLWPLPTTQVAVGRTPRKRLYYDVNLGASDPDLGFGVTRRLGPESVLHYRAFGVGLHGLSPIRQIREAVATSLSAQEYMARFYKQDASPGGVLKVDGNLEDEQFDRLKRQWREAHAGLERSHLLAILEGGASWESVGLNPNDAAFIETQKWETVEIARAFGVPPHMIGDVERSTSWGSGIAEQGIGFVTYTLTPWITRLEWVNRRGLLAPIDRRLRHKWRVDGLQRGDTKTRYEGYAVGKQWGWLSTNDIRSLEDMEPVSGGDVYLQPLNMVEAGGTSSGQEPARQRRVRSSAARKRIAGRFAPLLADADRAIAEVERAEVGDLVKAHLEDRSRAPAAFNEAVDEVYGDEMRERMESRFLPLVSALTAEVADDAAEEAGGEPPDLERWVQAYVASHVAYRAGRSAGAIRRLADREDAAAAIRRELDRWVEERPETTGRWESTQASRAAARETWRTNGIRQMTWVAGSACPLCADLDGQVVGIEQAFASSGQQINGGDDQPTLEVERDTFHPPLHPGCDCDIVPA